MQVGMTLVEMLRVNYWLKLRDIAQKQPVLRDHMAGMIVAPDKISYYLGRTHAAIEYFGQFVVNPSRSSEKRQPRYSVSNRTSLFGDA